MKLTSYGAAGEVTGSKHLLEVSGKRILLDCGMFQGSHEDDPHRNAILPFDASSIDVAILSHGHLDHCGSMPTLVKAGFKGKIYMTPATRDVAELIMRDAAKIQLQDAEYRNRHLRNGEAQHVPVYTDADVNAVLEHVAPLSYGQCETILPNVELCFYNAGHILGSALTHLTLQEDEKTVRLAYTGDLGQKVAPLLRAPDHLPPTDILLLESTYGYQQHRESSFGEEKLLEVVRWAIEHKGKVFIPAFALGRMQSLIYNLHRLIDQGALPNIPIYVDSPLASKMTTVFLKHHDEFDQEAMNEFNKAGHYPFGFLNLRYVESVEESKRLDEMPGPLLLLATSGMMEAGRILHHLRRGLPDPNNAVLIVCYLARGTTGRAILDGAKTVRIFGEHVPVRARVEKINVYSAHAGQDELLDFVAETAELREVWLVHGEDDSRNTLADALKKRLPKLEVKLLAPGEQQNML